MGGLYSTHFNNTDTMWNYLWSMFSILYRELCFSYGYKAYVLSVTYTQTTNYKPLCSLSFNREIMMACWLTPRLECLVVLCWDWITRKVFTMHGILAWRRTIKLSQVDGLIFFLNLYLGKSTLNRLYFNVDLMSTFYKVKVLVGKTPLWLHQGSECR